MCYADTATNAATTIATPQAKGMKVKVLRNIKADVEVNKKTMNYDF